MDDLFAPIKIADLFKNIRQYFHPDSCIIYLRFTRVRNVAKGRPIIGTYDRVLIAILHTDCVNTLGSCKQYWVYYGRNHNTPQVLYFHIVGILR